MSLLSNPHPHNLFSAPDLSPTDSNQPELKLYLSRDSEAAACKLVHRKVSKNMEIGVS